MKRVKITVAGRVQGVNFRWAAQRQAQKLGLAGFVRNQPDGTVYIEAEGAAETLEQFLQWCHRGPSSAKVEAVVMAEASPVGDQDFEIRY